MIIKHLICIGIVYLLGWYAIIRAAKEAPVLNDDTVMTPEEVAKIDDMIDLSWESAEQPYISLN